MKPAFVTILFFLFGFYLQAQDLYFPPLNNNEWESINPADLGWEQNNIDSLFAFLEANNSKAFILLKDGKIVLEEYFNGHDAESLWYWASAGKSLTGFLVGQAREKGYLSISDTTSSYLGEGWTSLTSEQEEKITIRHQLTMTSGLDDSNNPDCTDPECLQYLAEPGTRWAYHNAPYTLLSNVLEEATGVGINLIVQNWIKSITGMDGAYIQTDYNRVYYSTARSMARYGLLNLAKGHWDGTTVMEDMDYFYEMTHSSQDLNESYGYLWWLNGYDSYMIPQSQYVFDGWMMPDAPQDLFAALGKNGQFINVVPSQNMVWIRMGEAPDDFPVPFLLNNEIWTYINNLNQTGLSPTDADNSKLSVYPNPSHDQVEIRSSKNLVFIEIYNTTGQKVMEQPVHANKFLIDLSILRNGGYILISFNENGYVCSKKFTKY